MPRVLFSAWIIQYFRLCVSVAISLFSVYRTFKPYVGTGGSDEQMIDIGIKLLGPLHVAIHIGEILVGEMKDDLSRFSWG